MSSVVHAPASSNQVMQRDGSPAAALEAALICGDLAKLSEEQRLVYYRAVCDSVGLNPLTRPFEYLMMKGGKLVLYARKECTDQLRRIHKVSIQIVARERVEGVYLVVARATMPDGRTDESIGAVALTGKGEDLANAFMKAETKAKRRVTLSICGLGILDESELESIRDVQAPTPGPAALPAPTPPPIDARLSAQHRARLVSLYRAVKLREEIPAIRDEVRQQAGEITPADLNIIKAEHEAALARCPVAPAPAAAPEPQPVAAAANEADVAY